MEHEGHINAIRRRANIKAVKSLNVTVPCSFTSESNECITEATGWSQHRAVHLHPSVHPSSLPTRRASLKPPPYMPCSPKNMGCSVMVTESAALASVAVRSASHSNVGGNVSDMSFCRDGQCFFFPSPATEVTSPWKQLKRDRT